MTVFAARVEFSVFGCVHNLLQTWEILRSGQLYLAQRHTCTRQSLSVSPISGGPISFWPRLSEVCSGTARVSKVELGRLASIVVCHCFCPFFYEEQVQIKQSVITQLSTQTESESLTAYRTPD